MTCQGVFESQVMSGAVRWMFREYRSMKDFWDLAQQSQQPMEYIRENGCIHISAPGMKTMQGDNTAKKKAYRILQTEKNLAVALLEIETTGLDKDIRQAVAEIMTADL